MSPAATKWALRQLSVYWIILTGLCYFHSITDEKVGTIIMLGFKLLYNRCYTFFNQPGFLSQSRPPTRLGLEPGILKEMALSFGITREHLSRSWSLGNLATPRTAWGKWHCGTPLRITCTQNAAMIQLNSNISSVNIGGTYERNWIEIFLLSILKEVTGVTQLRQFIYVYCGKFWA